MFAPPRPGTRLYHFLIVPLLFVVPVLFPAYLDAISVDAVNKKLAAFDERIAAYEDGPLHDAILDVAKQEAAIEIANERFAEVKGVQAEILRDLGQAKAWQREMESKIFRLESSPLDFYKAKEYWEAALTEDGQRHWFKEMWKYFYGLHAEPSVTEYNDMDLHVRIMDLDVRKKLVARIGEALVKIGDLVIKFVKVFRPSPKMDALTKAMAQKTAQVLGRASDRVSGALHRYIPNLARYGSKIRQFVVSDELASSIVDNADEIFDLTEIDVLTTHAGPVTLNAKKSAEQIADDLNRIRNTAEFGHPEGREAALEQARRAQNMANLAVATKQAQADEMALKISTAQYRFDAANARLLAARDTLSDRQKRLQQLQDERESILDEALRAAEQAAVQESTGKRYARNVWLDFSGRTISLDPLTSALLQNPEFVRIKKGADFASEYRTTCSYRTKTGKGKEILKTIPIHGVRYDSIRPYSGANLRKTGGKGSVRASGSRLYGVTPGKVSLIASISPGLGGINRNQKQCGWDMQIYGGPPAESRTVEVTVLKVVEAGFTPGSWDRGSQKAGALDLFVDKGSLEEGRSNCNQGTLRLFCKVTDGANTWESTPGVLVRPIIRGSHSGLIINPGRSRFTFTANGPADATVLGAVESLSGKTVRLKGFKVTGNEVHGRVERPGGHDLDVPYGETATYRVEVSGGADMKNYHVRWRLEQGDSGSVRFPEKSSFMRGGGGHVAKGWFRVTNPRAMGREFAPMAQIVRNSDGKVVFEMSLPRSRAVLMLESMDFVFTGTRITARQLDFFLPSSTPVLDQGLELIFRRTDGEVDTAAADLAEIHTVGCPYLDVSGNRIELSYTCLDGRGNLGTSQVGASMVYARFDEQRAREKGIIMKDRAMSAKVLVTLNRLQVVKRGEGEDASYVLHVYGGADMPRFTAQWHLFGGIEESSAFEGAAGGWETACRGDRPFLQVDVVNPNGKVVGSISRFMDGDPLEEPEVSIRMPATAAPGQSVLVTTEISDLSLNDAFDCFCTWSADPAFGRFDSDVTRVFPLSGDQARCVNTLRLNRDSAITGESVPVGVRVFRSVGRELEE